MAAGLRSRARHEPALGEAAGAAGKRETSSEAASSAAVLSPSSRRWQIRVIYFIGFMVR